MRLRFLSVLRVIAALLLRIILVFSVIALLLYGLYLFLDLILN